MDLLKQIEQEAIETFGQENIGTKEMRMALTPAQKQELLQWLINRYVQYTGGAFHVEFI